MITDADNRTVLARSPRTAGTVAGVGVMIGRRLAPGSDALVFFNCGILCGRFAADRVDAVFLDRGMRVVKLCDGLTGFRWVAAHGAAVVLALPGGTVKSAGVEIGHHVNVCQDEASEPAIRAAVRIEPVSDAAMNFTPAERELEMR